MLGLVGHGGDGFLKFQDAEEISNVELADAFEQMWQKRRYSKVCTDWMEECVREYVAMIFCQSQSIAWYIATI